MNKLFVNKILFVLSVLMVNISCVYARETLMNQERIIDPYGKRIEMGISALSTGVTAGLAAYTAFGSITNNVYSPEAREGFLKRVLDGLADIRILPSLFYATGSMLSFSWFKRVKNRNYKLILTPR